MTMMKFFSAYNSDKELPVCLIPSNSEREGSPFTAIVGKILFIFACK